MRQRVNVSYYESRWRGFFIHFPRCSTWLLNFYMQYSNMELLTAVIKKEKLGHAQPDYFFNTFLFRPGVEYLKLCLQFAK
jgi:hypothetical protein